jgi:PAS domain S-box-containing protein
MLKIDEYSELVKTAFQAILDATGFDSGGVYFLNGKKNSFDLVYSHGVSVKFRQAVSSYPLDSPNFKLVQKGKCLYLNYKDLPVLKTEAEENEGLKSIAVVPIIYKGQAIGCVNVASRTLDQIAEETRNIIEALSGLIGQALSRSFLASALGESEEHYRGLADSISDVFFEMDRDLRYTYWNKASEELTGISAKEALGRSLIEIFPDVKGAKVEKIYLEVLRTQKPQSFENKYQIKGKNFIFEISAYPSKQGLSVFVKDITERKKAEEALRESEEKYRSLVERANDGIGITQDKLMKYMNPRGAEILGYTVQEIIGTPFTDYIHPDEVQRVISYYTRRMKDKKVPTKYESAVRNREGQKIPAEFNASVISYQGKAADMVIFRDITERKKAEEELREKEAFNFALFQYNPVQTMVVDRQGKVVKVNMAKRMSGDRLPNIGDVMYKDYAGKHEIDMHAELTECLKSGKTKSFPELKYGDKFLSITIAPFPEGAIITSMDITERKNAEKELKSSKEELQNLAAHLQSIREKERMLIAREIHDELGQSLTALKMDLSWLYKKMPRDKALLPKRTKSMLGLVDTTIQSVKRISSELRPGLLDDLGLSAAIEWQGEEFQNHTGIRCEVSVEPEDIILDQERSIAIFRIFQEALANVARHAKATRVKASLKKKAGKLELKVRDNGRGITEEKISDPKSFGLIGIRERAQFLDGTVEIRGIRDKGTTITVRIPLPEKGKNDKNPHRG